MSLTDEKPKSTGLTFTIDRPHPRPKLETIPDIDSLHSLTPTPTPTRPASSSSPFSPFYDHSEAPTTLSLSDPAAKSGGVTVYESDIEACLTESNSNNTLTLKKTSNNKDCTVWPGQRALKQAKKQERRRGECWNPMRNLDRRTKFWVKALIAAVIVGVAVAVGLGISRAVGGGIWKQSG